MTTHLGVREERTYLLREVLACREKEASETIGDCVLKRRRPQTIFPHVSQKRNGFVTRSTRLFPKEYYAFDIIRCTLSRRGNRGEQREL